LKPLFTRPDINGCDTDKVGRKEKGEMLGELVEMNDVGSGCVCLPWVHHPGRGEAKEGRVTIWDRGLRLFYFYFWRENFVVDLLFGFLLPCFFFFFFFVLELHCEIS